MNTAQASRAASIAASLVLSVITIVCFALPTRAAENGLILHLNLNEGSDTTAVDSSGGGNDAALIDGATWDSSGIVGSGVSLTGGSHMTGPRLELTGFTLSTWIKTAIDDRGDLILQYDDAPYAGFGLIINPGFAELGCGSGNLLGLWVGASSYICTPSTVAGLNDGAWHLVTATWDADTTTGSIYFDGDLLVQEVRADANTASTIETMYFGYNPYGKVGYEGSLDDIRIYDHALSADEIADIFSLIPPTVTLNGSSTVDLTIGDGFTDEGAVAEDFEGNALDVASSTDPDPLDADTAGTYIITYSATDATGLSASTTRTVTISEPANQPPTISLIGSSTIELTVGDVFTDEGVTVSDAEDAAEDLTVASSTEPIGGVDTNTAGTYTITYTVTDTDGASTSTTRTVSVSAADSEPDPDPEPEPDPDPETPPSDPTPSPEQPSDDDKPGIITGSRAVSRSVSVSSGGGRVLGASISCGKYLTGRLDTLQDNDKDEVIKLQALLKETVDPSLPMTGEFGPRTLGALKEFQLKYRKTIIDPWIQKGFITNGQPTGVVGETTLWTINTMVCPNLDLPQPVI